LRSLADTLRLPFLCAAAAAAALAAALLSMGVDWYEGLIRRAVLFRLPRPQLSPSPSSLLESSEAASQNPPLKSPKYKINFVEFLDDK